MTPHYSLPLHGGTTSSHYGTADYDYGPRRPRRYTDGLYGDSYLMPPMVKKYPVGSRHHHHRKKERSRSINSGRVPFETAMDQLYTTLMDAVGFFKNFESSFASDIGAIKPYASPAIIDELWKAKVLDLDKSCRLRSSSSSSRRAVPVVDDGWRKADDSNSSPPVVEGSFQEHIKRVREVMEDAIHSRSREHGERLSRLGIDSMNRLWEKLSIQHETLRRICGKMYKVRSYVHEFVKECELILVYMDKSRDLWQPEGVKDGRDDDHAFGEEPVSGEGGPGTYASWETRAGR